MKILLVYLSWTLIKACRAFTHTHTHTRHEYTSCFKWDKIVIFFSSVFKRTLHMKRFVLDHLRRGVRAFGERRSQRNWNFGIIWVWARFAISTTCRDLPAEISASLCIFSFNQSRFPSDVKKGVCLVFSSAILLYIYTQTYTYIYISPSQKHNAELLLYNIHLLPLQRHSLLLASRREYKHKTQYQFIIN